MRGLGQLWPAAAPGPSPADLALRESARVAAAAVSDLMDAADRHADAWPDDVVALTAAVAVATRLERAGERR